MNTQKQKVGENLLYGMVWLVVFLIPIMNSQMMSELHLNLNNLITAWYKIVPYFLAFIIHNSVLCPQLLLKKRFLAYVGTSMALLFVIFFGIYIYDISQNGEVETVISDRHASFTNLEWYWNICLGLFMYGTNAFVKLLYAEMRKETETERLKRQGLQAEIDYLKYQINPHFFMNTLNNIHALIDIDAESAKSCVIELSKMMRYVLYDSGAERIPLNKDMAFISNYIELMRIRYSSEVDIQFNYPHNVPQSVGITPLIFIVFIENAFKHGVSYSHKSYIHINITCGEESVTAEFVNSRHKESVATQGGIGLDNVRKRLELTYPDRYTLDIDDSADDRYSVKITIPILR